MLDLVMSNGAAYIWSAQDWYTLRTEHRIIGYFDGAQSESDKTKILPVRLTKPETQFLVKHGIGRTVEIPKLKTSIPSTETRDKFEEQRAEICDKQLETYKEKRRSDILSNVDKIIEGKKKKGKSIVPDREIVIQEEMAKISAASVPPFEMVQIDMADPWIDPEDVIPVECPESESELDELRLRVFEDFHSVRKYFLTCGLKFGGDFLAYPGDPLTHHAQFIIMCQAKPKDYPKDFLISQKRLAHAVKKTLLLASIDKDTNELVYEQI